MQLLLSLNKKPRGKLSYKKKQLADASSEGNFPEKEFTRKGHHQEYLLWTII